MTIKGIGIDIQEVDKLKKVLSKMSPKKLLRIFTNDEIQYCQKRIDPYIHFSGKFAAKEAIIKCLDIKQEFGLILSDVEIRSDKYGKPICNISSNLHEKIEDLDETKIFISISHDEKYAASVAIWSN
jgi:holo-[acyl-carrier protein] synthase